MAEHRAAVNALLSIFLMRSDKVESLPTSLHGDKTLIGDATLEEAFQGLKLMTEGSEVLAGSRSKTNGWTQQR
jgi:hypothetical protein